MHFDHAERGSRLVRHGVYGEVETHLVGKQTLDLQVRIISQRMRRHRILIGHNQARRFEQKPMPGMAFR